MLSVRGGVCGRGAGVRAAGGAVECDARARELRPRAPLPALAPLPAPAPAPAARVLSRTPQ
eukprot:3211573-Rhodomonas_salina.1